MTTRSFENLPASMRSSMTVMILVAILVLTVFRPAEAADSSGEACGKIPAVISVPDQRELAQAVKTPNTGILVTDDQGQVLFSRNPDTYMMPASILKILTSLAAMEHWGPKYRFITRAAWDTVSLTLYVQGMGDPLFVSEAILHFCRQIKEKNGMNTVHTVVVDQGYFASDIIIPGTGQSLNPYDATTGALCANFNTVHFTWDAASDAFVSAEPQTPLLDRFKKTIHQTGLKQGRILLEKDLQPLYPGLLMAWFLNDLGVEVNGPVETGPLPDSFLKNSGPGSLSQKPLILLSPWDLEDVVKKLLAFSNNFIANQVMLALGAHRYGPPATLDKGVRALTDCAANLPGWETARIAEGSGISRQNRVTPAQMGQLLLAFMPHHELLRRTPTQYYKTGTLNGIRTRAGYFIGTDQRLYPFVIMKN